MSGVPSPISLRGAEQEPGSAFGRFGGELEALPSRSCFCPSALCHERALSAQAWHPEPPRVLPCLSQPSVPSLSPHCPLLPAGIFIALLLRFDIR